MDRTSRGFGSKRRWLAAGALVLIPIAIGCKEKAPTSTSASTPVVDAMSVSASSSSALSPDAGAPKRETVNLLYFTPAQVWVSSKVDNPKDFPEHLVDGKPETAWNGKTEDLHGYIAFRVPDDAHVESVFLSTGFDATSKSGDDLFHGNHRITKLALVHRGKKLREVTLDPEKREPQPIFVGGDGGEYRLEILETLPGTKKAWRELVVSELRVMGSPGKDRLAIATLPEVRVGSAEAHDAGKDAAPETPGTSGTDGYPSLAALCKAHGAKMSPIFRAAADEYPGFVEGPYCVVLGGAPLADKLPEPFLDVRKVVLFRESRKETVAVVHTAAGYFPTTVVGGLEELRNPGCAGRVSATFGPVVPLETAQGPALELETVELDESFPFPTMLEDGGMDRSPGSLSRTRRHHVCRVVRDRVACTGTVTGKSSVDYAGAAPTLVPPWEDVKRREIRPTGEVVYK
jgi:hypothetical protein